MERNELIQERKRLIQDKQELLKRLDKLYLNYNLTGDDDKYGLRIQATEDELDDIQAELDYVNEELELDKKFKQMRLSV